MPGAVRRLEPAGAPQSQRGGETPHIEGRRRQLLRQSCGIRATDQGFRSLSPSSRRGRARAGARRTHRRQESLGTDELFVDIKEKDSVP